MSDEIAIQQLMNRYTEGSSSANWDQVLNTFAPDGIWEVPSIGWTLQGDPAIREAMKSFVGQMSYYVQVASPAVIEISGDVATARSVIRETGRFRDRDEALEVCGIYEDELRRFEDGWKFVRRRFVSKGMHSFPVNPAAS